MLLVFSLLLVCFPLNIICSQSFFQPNSFFNDRFDEINQTITAESDSGIKKVHTSGFLFSPNDNIFFKTTLEEGCIITPTLILVSKTLSNASDLDCARHLIRLLDDAETQDKFLETLSDHNVSIAIRFDSENKFKIFHSPANQMNIFEIDKNSAMFLPQICNLVAKAILHSNASLESAVDMFQKAITSTEASKDYIFFAFSHGGGKFESISIPSQVSLIVKSTDYDAPTTLKKGNSKDMNSFNRFSSRTNTRQHNARLEVVLENGYYNSTSITNNSMPIRRRSTKNANQIKSNNLKPTASRPNHTDLNVKNPSTHSTMVSPGISLKPTTINNFTSRSRSISNLSTHPVLLPFSPRYSGNVDFSRLPPNNFARYYPQTKIQQSRGPMTRALGGKRTESQEKH